MKKDNTKNIRMKKTKLSKRGWISLGCVFGVVLILGLALGGVMIFPRDKTLEPSLWANTDDFDISTTQSLSMKDDQFRILQLSDIQMWGLWLFPKTKKNITKLIEKTNPDLIVLTGDNAWGTSAALSVKKLSKFLSSFDIPWATTFGNHDSESNVSRSWLSDFYSKQKNSLFQNGPTNIHGNGNYVLNIKKNDEIVSSVFLIDSNNTRKYEDGEYYDYIYEDQIDWYEWNVKGLSKEKFGNYDKESGKVVPSVCFFHIPLMEYQTAYNKYSAGEISGRYINNETVCCPRINTGFFERAKELGSTRLISVGHDHINNSILEFEGITLAYGLKSSSYSYHDKMLQGGSVITISSSGDVEMDHVSFSDC